MHLVSRYRSNRSELSYVNKGRHEPVYDTLQCIAQYAKSLPEQTRKLIKASASSNEALEAIQPIVLNDRTLKSLVGTTQAVDLIHGGVKSNALPEQAWAVVNHRISVVRFVDSQSTLSERVKIDRIVLLPRFKHTTPLS